MSLSKLTVRRLLKLADFLDSLPSSAAQHFDLDTWFCHEKKDHAHRVGPYITRRALNHCGTTACALGWASTIPSFRKAGLKIATRSFGPEPLRKAEKFFGLTTQQAEFLFVWGSDSDSPKAWAKHCHKFVQDRLADKV